MAEDKITKSGTNSLDKRAGGSKRRELLEAIGFVGLTAAAAAGFVRPDRLGAETGAPTPPDADGVLLAACASFTEAHRRLSKDPQADEATVRRLVARWDAAAEAVTAAPKPVTLLGRVALAKAAKAALVDQVSGGQPWKVHQHASREERLVLVALTCMSEC